MTEVASAAPPLPMPTREEIARLAHLRADADNKGRTFPAGSAAELARLEALAAAWAASIVPLPLCCSTPDRQLDLDRAIYCGACLAELAPAPTAPTAPPAIPDPPAAPTRFSPLAAAEGPRLLAAFTGARHSFGWADWKTLVEGLDEIIHERPVYPGEGKPSEVRADVGVALSGDGIAFHVEGEKDCPRDLPCSRVGHHFDDECTPEPSTEEPKPEPMPVEARCRAHLLGACTDMARVPKWLEGDAVSKGGFAAEDVRRVWQALKDEGAVVMRGTDRWQKAPSYEDSNENPGGWKPGVELFKASDEKPAAKPKDVPCPSCSAPAGSSCVDGIGRPVPVMHHARVAAARAQLPLPAAPAAEVAP